MPDAGEGLNRAQFACALRLVAICAEPRHAAAGSAALAGDQRPASAAAAPGAAAQALRAQHVRLLLAALLTEAAMCRRHAEHQQSFLPPTHDLVSKLPGCCCWLPEGNPFAAHGRLGAQAQGAAGAAAGGAAAQRGQTGCRVGFPVHGAKPAGLQGSQEMAELAGAKPSGPLVDWGVGSFAARRRLLCGVSGRPQPAGGTGCAAAQTHSRRPRRLTPLSSAAPGVGAQRRLHRSRSAQGARPSSPPLALGTSAVGDMGAMLQLRGGSPQQEGPGRTSSDGAQLGQLPLVRTGIAWRGQPEDVPMGRERRASRGIGRRASGGTGAATATAPSKAQRAPSPAGCWWGFAVCR